MNARIWFFLMMLLAVSCSSEGGAKLQANRRLQAMNAKDFFDSSLQVELAHACENGNTNSIRSLIDQGADVNYQGREGMRPLFWALAKKNLISFKFLLDNRADPNVVTEEQPARESAMKLAACMETPDFLQELIRHGGNPNLALGKSQQTPIFDAAFIGRTNNITILLANGAKIDWQDISKATPMHQAIGGRQFEMALFLYHHGANPSIKDRWGYSPIDTINKFRDNGVVSNRDKKAYKQLLYELHQNGLL